MPHLTGRLLLTGSFFLPGAAAVLGHGEELDPHRSVATTPMVVTLAAPAGDTVRSVEAPLHVSSPTTRSDMNQRIEYPGLASVRFTTYLPLATLIQRMSAATGDCSYRIVRISISGAKQSYDRCLVAGDPARNRLDSLIGSWRFAAADDGDERSRLFRAFETELSRTPCLVIETGPGRSCELPVRVSAEYDLDELGASVRVLEFYPNFARDPRTGQSVNESDRLRNPAVHLEIRKGSAQERRWVFSRFPRFKNDDSGSLPIRIALDCPLELDTASPDFSIVLVGSASFELWTRHAGRTTSKPIDIGEEHAVPDSNYRFAVVAYEPAGQLIESYEPTEDRTSGVTALEFETTDPAGATNRHWVVRGKSTTIVTDHGPLTVTFGSRPATGPGVRHGHR